MSKTILILENDQEIKKILQQQLVREGFEVHCPVDTYVALECVESASVDLLILHDKMPIINGSDTVKLLRSEGKHIPVIVFLPKSEPTSNYDNYINCHCVHKPFRVDTLIHKVNELLNM